jgi:exonuclease SbcC
LVDTVAANAAAEDVLKNFDPFWSDAERLDSEPAVARTKLSDAMEKSQEAEASLRDRANALASIDRALGQTSELHRTTVAQLKRQQIAAQRDELEAQAGGRQGDAKTNS